MVYHGGFMMHVSGNTDLLQFIVFLYDSSVSINRNVYNQCIALLNVLRILLIALKLMKPRGRSPLGFGVLLVKSRLTHFGCHSVKNLQLLYPLVADNCCEAFFIV